MENQPSSNFSLVNDGLTARRLSRQIGNALGTVVACTIAPVKFAGMFSVKSPTYDLDKILLALDGIHCFGVMELGIQCTVSRYSSCGYEQPHWMARLVLNFSQQHTFLEQCNSAFKKGALPDGTCVMSSMTVVEPHAAGAWMLGYLKEPVAEYEADTRYRDAFDGLQQVSLIDISAPPYHPRRSLTQEFYEDVQKLMAEQTSPRIFGIGAGTRVVQYLERFPV